jgi:peptidyl-dipeptidase A
MRLTIILLAFAVASCAGDSMADVDGFLASYDSTYKKLYYESAQAEWASNTHIIEGDSTNATRTKAANRALLAFTGDTANVARIKGYLAARDELTPLQARRLYKMLYNAALGSQTIPEVIAARVAADAEQTEKLYGFRFTIRGKEVSPNDIDNTLRESRNLSARRAAWESSKEVGKVLKPGILALRDLRNQTVQALDYPDFFAYQVSDYGMTPDEMLALTDRLIADTRPLYRELHTWARYELAKRYGVPVPDLIPADWLPNRWGQEWGALVSVSGLNVDSSLSRQTPEWIVKQGEAFYVSLGFQPLPSSFWEKSSLYPVPANSPFKKNTHASAWHMDLENDVRSLMSVENNAWWYETAHHELGHIYYYQAYTNPEVPLVLREGANRAYHEAIGSMIGFAAGKPMFLQNRGLIAKDASSDQMMQMLQEALNYIVFIPFAAGTMTRFEHALYSDRLPGDRFNSKWWELVARYQGIAPPAPRDETFADGLTKTHINDDPAQYYDYALSFALLFQMHDHIAKKILNQDPHNTDYYGSKGVGDFLRALMSPGASRDWREVLKETTGSELNGQSMVDYFKPLYDWLLEQNKGRKATLPS